MSAERPTILLVEDQAIIALAEAERLRHHGYAVTTAHTPGEFVLLPSVSMVLDLEYRISTPDGEIRWIHDRVEYRRDSRGVPTRVFGTLQDLTDLKRVELSLQA